MAPRGGDSRSGFDSGIGFVGESLIFCKEMCVNVWHRTISSEKKLWCNCLWEGGCGCNRTGEETPLFY